MSVVVIPCWRRPEFLAATLKKISGAEGWGQNKYLFQLDAAHDPQIFDVIQDATDALGYFYPSIYAVDKRRGIGNSYNVLRGLKHGLDLAYTFDAEIIHLIEEDIWVGRDYFNFHEKTHAQFKPWAVSACRNQHLWADPPSSNPAAVYKSTDYQSLGVSFPLSSVEEILIHDTPEYYKDPIAYCHSLFPNSKFGSLFPEQDGLIARIIEKNSYDVIYPFAPRAFHAGFYSYHREGKEPTGTLVEKIEQLENMTEAEMNERSSYKDIRFPGFVAQDFDNLVLAPSPDFY